MNYKQIPLKKGPKEEDIIGLIRFTEEGHKIMKAIADKVLISIIQLEDHNGDREIVEAKIVTDININKK